MVLQNLRLQAAIVSFAMIVGLSVRTLAADRPPNFVIIFADDLGYGDLGCYGHPTIRTPNLDRMAAEGMRFTQFYSAAEVCTPSRAALMTGRLPIRSGMCSEHAAGAVSVFGRRPARQRDHDGRGPQGQGLRDGCVGKWHLGHLPQYLPTKHGFDAYFGIPYSNDMKPTPLMRNEQIIEEPAVQETLTPRYTEEAIRFIKENRDKPFFLYLPHTYPHVPLHASDRFRDKSPRGLYGDVVEELDWSVGQVLQTLRRPWPGREHAGLLHQRQRPVAGQEPERRLGRTAAATARAAPGKAACASRASPGGPGTIKPGRSVTALAGTMDLFPTFVEAGRRRDPQGPSARRRGHEPGAVGHGAGQAAICISTIAASGCMAVRKGPWKAHLVTQDGYTKDPPTEHDPPLLFQLEQDPSERFDVAKEHPEVVADLLAEIERHKATVQPVESPTDRPDCRGSNQAAPGASALLPPGLCFTGSSYRCNLSHHWQSLSVINHGRLACIHFANWSLLSVRWSSSPPAARPSGGSAWPSTRTRSTPPGSASASATCTAWPTSTSTSTSRGPSRSRAGPRAASSGSARPTGLSATTTPTSSTSTCSCMEKYGPEPTYENLAEFWKRCINHYIWVANRSARDLMEQGLPAAADRPAGPQPQLVPDRPATGLRDLGGHRPGHARVLRRQGRLGRQGDQRRLRHAPDHLVQRRCARRRSSRATPNGSARSATSSCPPGSLFRQAIDDVRQWKAEHGADWVAVRKKIKEKYHGPQGHARGLSPPAASGRS